MLELASLPREQIGPFLLLGLNKAADKEAIDAHWAARLKWARKNAVKVPLEDVNWAREGLSDVSRRLKADAAGLNGDLAELPLERLAKLYGQDGAARWRPLDRPQPAAHDAPPCELPDRTATAAAVVLPEPPEDDAAVLHLLEELAAAPLDPWAFHFSTEERKPAPAPEDDAP